MKKNDQFEHIIILNLDGLRQDVFIRLLEASKALRELFNDSDSSHHFSPKSIVPSITFAAQATITTGETPDIHEIVGNQFFDRLGALTEGKPKFYALDVASGIDAIDAAKVFMVPGQGNKLLSKEVPTIYEIARASKKVSLCTYHMYSRGAHYWIRPKLHELFLLKKYWKILDKFPAWFERQMMKRLINHLSNSSFPNLIMTYFMSLDAISHRDGPDAQFNYFLEVVDPLLLELIETTRKRTKNSKTLFIIVSDHGHAKVRKDKSFSLKAIGALDQRLSPIQALRERGSFNLNSSNLVLGNNSGLGYLYVREKASKWNTPPSFALVKETALTFLNASNEEAPFEPISGLLVRNVEEDGWEADYMGFLPTGETISLVEYFSRLTGQFHSKIPEIIGSMSTSFSGDILLLPNTELGFSFGEGFLGNHGGITNDEQECVLSLATPGEGETLKNVLNKVHENFKDEPAVSELQYVASIVKWGLTKGDL